MNGYIPDNFNAFEDYEAEQERIRRLRKRHAHVWGEEEESGLEEYDQMEVAI